MNDQLIRKITEKFGTPVYIYDSSIMDKQVKLLKNLLPPRFQIFYSMKANPLLWLCEYFWKSGLGIEVASEGELYVALQSGVAPQDLIFTSPGKTQREIAFAVESGIYSINIESLAEAEIINSIAAGKGRTVQVSLRINPDFDYSQAGMKMTGVASQFGIDQERAGEVIRAVKKLSHLDLIGLHVYTGTQILAADEIIATMDAIFHLAADLRRKHTLTLQFLDLGGGFGVPYFKDDPSLDTAHLQKGLAEIWGSHGAQFAHTRIAVESGRFLMAEAGVYAVKVLYKKNSKGKNYLICDGGSQHNAVSAFLGRRVRNNFPVRIIGRENRPDVPEKTVVTGPLNASTDVIGQDILLPPAEEGDILVIEKTGAYGLTFSPVNSGSHPLPAEVVLHNDRFYLARQRGEPADALKSQQLIPGM